VFGNKFVSHERNDNSIATILGHGPPATRTVPSDPESAAINAINVWS
jgi:hypothetical protein